MQPSEPDLRLTLVRIHRRMLRRMRNGGGPIVRSATVTFDRVV